MARKPDKQPPKTKKYYRSTKSGAGMTKAEKAKRVAQKKRLGQPAGKPRRVEAARRKKRG